MDPGFSPDACSGDYASGRKRQRHVSRRRKLKIFVTQLIPQAGLEILRRAHPDYRINAEERVLGREELLEAGPGRGCAA